MNSYKRRGLLCLTGGLLGLYSLGAIAQDSLLEEIVVTAQKREQSQQDVPIAVTAFTGDMLQDSGIADIRDLAAIAPTLRSSQSQNSTTSSFGIRGIGTSSQNFGLESSVGIYVDGVYRARQSSIINNLADIAAIEVLRGPQGTLFGKNTPSGALNIRTVQPDHDTNAFAEITAGDYGLLNFKAATNISLVDDKAALRATVFSGKRDGVVSELSAGKDVINDRDRFGGRVQLYLTPNDKFDVRVIADYGKIDEICCAALPRMNNFAGAAGAGSDAYIAGVLGVPVILAENFDDYTMAINRLPRSTNEDGGLSVEVNYDFENVTLTSISAYRSFESTDNIDADFGRAEIVYDENLAEQKSFSQELRLAGQFGESQSNYVVGLYYFSQDLDNFSTLTAGADTNEFFFLDPTLTAVRGGIDLVSALTGGAFPLSATGFPDGDVAIDDMRQEHESYAAFAQVDFAISDALTITAGLRYTDEEKTMNYDFINSPTIGPPPDITAIATTLGLLQAGMLDLTDPATQAQVFAAFAPTYVPGWGFYLEPSLGPQASGVELLKDDQITGTLKASWFVGDSTMFYASYGTGYKSGGTNTDRISPALPQFFGPETSESIEIGMKTEFPDQGIRLNVAIHDTEVEDLQTSAFAGAGFNLANAGIADTQGVEIDMLWLPTDSLEVSLAYAYNTADLENFEMGTCWLATPFFTGVDDPGRANPGDVFCNRSGGRVAANPEHNFFLGVKQDFSVGDSKNAYVRAEYTRVSDTMTDGNNEPLKLRPDFDRVNLMMGLVFDDLNAELSIWGRNITDERFYETIFDVPLQNGKLNAYPHEPRTWGVTFRKNFD